MIYEPREDSYLLQKWVKKCAEGKVLDMGCGCGIQAMAALKKTKKVLATDINPEAVQSVKKKGINAIVSDLFSNIKEKFDLIIFNPPYLPKQAGENKNFALTTSGKEGGYEIIRKFLKNAKKHLTKKGQILLLSSSLTGNVQKLINEYGYRSECLETKKLFFEKLFVHKIILNEKDLNSST